jgi:hypothetical protein
MYKRGLLTDNDVGQGGTSLEDEDSVVITALLLSRALDTPIKDNISTIERLASGNCHGRIEDAAAGGVGLLTLDGLRSAGDLGPEGEWVGGGGGDEGQRGHGDHAVLHLAFWICCFWRERLLNGKVVCDQAGLVMERMGDDKRSLCKEGKKSKTTNERGLEKFRG